jgi:hypothetical protein
MITQRHHNQAQQCIQTKISKEETLTKYIHQITQPADIVAQFVVPVAEHG